MKTFHRRLIIFLLALIPTVWLLPGVLAQDQDLDGLTLRAVAGFDEFYRGENWFPVQVTLANDGPLVEGFIEINTGSAGGGGTPYRLPVVLPTQSQQQATLYIYSASFNNQIDIDLRDNNGDLLLRQTETLRRVNNGERLFAVVSPDPGEFTFLENIGSGSTRTSVAFMELSHLPETAVAWKALDIVVMNDVDTAQLSNAQRRALRQWINVGGQLVVTGGSGWQKTTAGLQDLLPVAVTGSRTVEDLPGLRQEAAIPFRDPGPYLIAESRLTAGSLLFYEEDLPILASQRYGRGHVFFLALDPRFAPLLDWDGNELLWAAVLNRVETGDSWGKGPLNSYAAGSAVSSLPALALPSIITLLIFLLVYTVLAGPVNYLVLKRMGRTELAWGTIPVLVLLFSAATYVTGFQLRGNTTIINQMSVAYSTAGEEEANVHALVGLYSPRRMNYDLSFGDEALARPFRQEFGPGLSSGEGGSGIVTFTNEHKIEDIRVDISGIETFIVEGNRPALDLGGQATLNIIDNRVELEVDVQNNSDVPLQTATVLMGSTAVAVGDLAPGESTTVNQVLRTLSSASTLNPSGGISFAPPSSGSPLTSNANTILGSSNYYDDRDLYPRFEFLQALESSNFGGPTSFSFGTNNVILIAWSDEWQLPLSIDNDDVEFVNTTLHMISLPLQQNLISGNDVTIPVSLMNWSTIAQNNIYDPRIEFLALNQGWIEFEFEPWPEFQTMEVTDLAINVTAAPGSEIYPFPSVSLYNWQEGEWAVLDMAEWGEWPVASIEPFIGQNNRVRLRLEDNSTDFGLTIESVYPVISGRTQ